MPMSIPLYLLCCMPCIVLFSLFDIRFPNADSPWGAFPVWAKLGDSAGKPLRRPPKRIQLHLLPLSSLPFYSSSSSLLKPLRGFPLSVSIPFWIVSRDPFSDFAPSPPIPQYRRLFAYPPPCPPTPSRSPSPSSTSSLLVLSRVCLRYV